MALWKEYQVDVPEGVSGDWSVERFTVTASEAESSRLRALFQGGRGEVEAGSYTAIKHRGAIIMSDTQDEISDHVGVIHRARGRCLVNGLGLGMVVAAMLRKPEVQHVTAVEIEEDVIRLVADHWRDRFGGRLEVIHADAMTYQPPKGARYDVVWHDIWPDICEDNLSEMATLHRRYRRRAKWQGSWSYYLCKRFAGKC